MTDMFAMGLDIDSGASLDDVLAKLKSLGLFCLVYSSYNHGKSGLQLKRDDVLRKLKIKSDPSLIEIQQYLREFDKSRFEEDFIARVSIKSAKKQVKAGVVIELDTPRLDKFRLIWECHELCVWLPAHAGVSRGHAWKRSANMISNWLRAANHSRTFLPPFSKLRMAR